MEPEGYTKALTLTDKHNHIIFKRPSDSDPWKDMRAEWALQSLFGRVTCTQVPGETGYNWKMQAALDEKDCILSLTIVGHFVGFAPQGTTAPTDHPTTIENFGCPDHHFHFWPNREGPTSLFDADGNVILKRYSIEDPWTRCDADAEWYYRHDDHSSKAKSGVKSLRDDKPWWKYNNRKEGVKDPDTREKMILSMTETSEGSKKWKHVCVDGKKSKKLDVGFGRSGYDYFTRSYKDSQYFLGVSVVIYSVRKIAFV